MIYFEWDEQKREKNLQRHKLDFVAATQLFDGRPVISRLSPRDGEVRVMSTGIIAGKFYTVIWTEREETIRLISFRRARDEEAGHYFDLYGTRT